MKRKILYILISFFILSIFTSCKIEGIIELNYESSSIELTVGDEVNVKPNVKSENIDNFTLEYSLSSDIASIDNEGTLKALKEGELILTVSVKEYSNVSIDLKIIIKEQPKNEYTISYDLDGGLFNEEIKTSFLEDEIVVLPSPLKEGYKFLGWYENNILINTIENKNYSLVAKWEEIKKISYKVTFIIDGKIIEINVFENELVEKPNDPIKENHTFLYFAIDDFEYDFNSVVTSDITLVAKFKENIIVEGLIYNLLDNGTYEVIGIGKYDNKDIIIPSVYNNLKVTKIKEYAFKDCFDITSIYIPSSIESIGFGAFSNCSSIESLTLPFIGESKENNTYLGFIFGATSYEYNLGFVPSSLKSVTLLEGCTSILENAFYECMNINNIIIPNSLNYIGESAFYSCIGIKDITLSKSIEYIGLGAFYYCINLKSISLPFVGETINSKNYLSHLFGGTSYKDNIKFIPSSLKEVTLLEGIKTIETYTFYNCKDIEKISFSNTIETIKTNSIAYCTSLKSIYVPLSVTLIERNSFAGCTAIEEMTLPFIGGSKDENCYLSFLFGGWSYKFSHVPSTLKKVTILDGLETIDEGAFYRCSNLSVVVIPKSVKVIKKDAFFNCTNLTICLEDSKLSDGFVDGFNPNNLEIFYNISSTNFINDDNFNYVIDFNQNKAIIYGYIGKNSDVIIPEEITYNYDDFKITKIANYIFKDNDNIKSITIPYIDNIKFSSLFESKNTLNSVTVLGTYKEIPSSMFLEFKYLENVNLQEGIEVINTTAFYNCTKLKNISLPSTLKTIMPSAFKNCYSLVNINIPKSVETIYSDAFYGCTKLTVYCEVESALDTYMGLDGSISFHKVYYNCNSSNFITLDDFIYLLDLNNNTARVVRYIGNKKEIIIKNEINYNNQKFKINEIGYSAIDATLKIDSISLPFIGESNNSNLYFGYIFGIEINNYVETIIKKVIVLDGCTFIPEKAFYYCNTIEEIVIPSSVEYIGKLAFAGGMSLKKLTLPFIGESLDTNRYLAYLFSENDDIEVCNSFLEEVTVLEGVTAIYENAFVGFNGLTTVYLPDSVTHIYDRAFYKGTVLNLRLGKNVVYIGKSAFEKCRIFYLDLPDCIALIDEAAFKESALQEINFPKSTDTIKKSTYEGIDSYIDPVISDNIKYIEENAFANCKKINKITFSSSIISIKSNAFYQCNSLISLYYNGTINDWLNIEFENEYSTPMHKAYNFYILNNYEYLFLRNISIPDNITTIGNNQFLGFKAIESVSLPNTITYIGTNAFKNCYHLTKIVISKNVDFIGENAFKLCSKLFIYCELEKEKLTWDKNWNIDNREVYYNYQN